MKNSFRAQGIYFRQFLKILTFFALIPLLSYAQTSPDYLFSDDNGSGWNWTTGTQGTAALGSSFKWQFQATASTNQYLKFGETSSSADGSGFWMNNSAPNLQYTGNGSVWYGYYYGNLNTNGAFYFPIVSGNYYVIKSMKDPSNSNVDFSIQEVSATPISINSVTDNFQAAGSSMDIYITLSGSKSAQERIFVKYTTDNWATSSITAEATGSGTDYVATIPGAGVPATSNNQ